MCGVLALAVLAGFLSSVANNFINFDDQYYVTHNAHVANGLLWANVRWAFTDAHLGTWHPLTWISHMVDVQLYGLKPGGHHLTSVLLHTANTLLLFLLLQRLTGTFWRSAMAAALFGLHPLRVESVVWVSERKDLLSGCLFLLTLWAYGCFAQAAAARSGKAKAWYGLALALFALGLMSKPMLVTAPLVLVLLDVWPLRRFQISKGSRPALRFASLLWEKVPFFAMAVVDGIITFWAQKQAGAVKELAELPLGDRAMNAVISYWRYLGKIVWPADLSVFYPFPGGWPHWQVVGAILMLVMVTMVFAIQRQRRPWLWVGWLWYLIMITPVIGFVQTGMQAMADRYSYLPSIGLFVLISWTGGELAERKQWRPVIAGVAPVLLLVLLVVTRQQVRYWASSETLFRHALAVTSGNALAHHCLGSALYVRGELAEATAEFRAALRLRPAYQDAEVGLAIALADQGQQAEAVRHFEEALRRNPRDAQARFYFGNLIGREGKFEEALGEYREAVSLDPDFAPAQNNLANGLQRLGRLDEAIIHYREALRVAPELAEAHNNLGIALAAKGRTEEAIGHYRAALRSRPDYAEAYNNLGNAQAGLGRLEEAVTNFLAAIQRRPQYPKAENSLGCALAMGGRTAEAIQHFKLALLLAPDYGEAHFNLANALLRRGQDREAALHLQEALRLDPGNSKALSVLADLYAEEGGTFRDPAEAVRLAERADQLSRGRDAGVLETLAKAYAAAGQLTNAVDAAQRGLEIASRLGQTNRVETLRNRLRQYQSAGH
jgi:protein O-mannosyl-transferase